MGVAQRLYEGVDLGARARSGLITYMRTDSPRVAPEAIEGAREWIGKQLGKRKYLPETPNVYKGKKDAQDAHEAIRPTDAARTPESIARYPERRAAEALHADLAALCGFADDAGGLRRDHGEDCRGFARTGKTYDFRVSGSVLRFDGFLKVYEVSEDKKDDDDESANKLPNLDGVKTLELEKLEPEQHFTQPPPRYNEASLVKELEERGIGRPSTYASIINTIQDREYVVKHGGSRGRFYPTEIGVVVCDLLVENFPYIFDTAYTAKLEEELDDIEEGKEKWTDLLNGFYDHFEDELKDAGKKMENIKRMEQKTGRKVRLCGSPLVLKWGKFGTLLCVLGLQQEGSDELHVHQGEHRGQAGPEHAGGAGGGRHRGVLRELRQGDGAAARAVRAVHGLPGLQRRSAVQDDPQAEPEAAAEAARADGRGLPGVRQAAGAAAGSVRRVCFLLRLSPSAST
jgi:DNA topoisomerase I